MTIKTHDVMLTREGAEVGDLPYQERVQVVEYDDHLAALRREREPVNTVSQSDSKVIE